MIQKKNLRFGDIVWTNFDPSIGYEFKGNRPAIVIQSSKQLRKSNLVSSPLRSCVIGFISGAAL